MLYQDNKNCNIAKMNSFEQIILKYQLNINFSLDFINSNPDANLVEDIINQLQKNDWNFIFEDNQLLEQIIINSSIYIYIVFFMRYTNEQNLFRAKFSPYAAKIAKNKKTLLFKT